MKVYGIYVSDYESGHFEPPFYSTKEKAYDAMRAKLLDLMKETKRMQEFTKLEFMNTDYKDWRQESVDKWIGGYCDYESIQVVEIDVI